MGNTALFSITGEKGGITQCIGIRKSYQIGNKWYQVIPNYHPSYILRNPKIESEFIRVMEIVKEYINANTGTTGSS